MEIGFVHVPGGVVGWIARWVSIYTLETKWCIHDDVGLNPPLVGQDRTSVSNLMYLDARVR